MSSQAPGPPGYEQDRSKHLLYLYPGCCEEEEEEEAAECRWFFLLPGSYLISVQVCRKKPCWDLGQKGRNQDQQGQHSPASGPGAAFLAGAATGFAASSSLAWQSLCPPVASVRQGPGQREIPKSCVSELPLRSRLGLKLCKTVCLKPG